ERLDWEMENDCIRKMREWIISSNISTEIELDTIDKNIKKQVREGKKLAWEAYQNPIKEEQQEAIQLITNLANSSINKVFIDRVITELTNVSDPIRKDIASAVRKSLRYVITENTPEKRIL